MRKKFYETPSIDFKMFQSQEDLLAYTSTEEFPDEWGDEEDGEEQVIKMKKICLLLVLILSVLCVFASCKKNSTEGNNSDVSSTGSKIEYVGENESLTSEEYEDLVSWWNEVTSNSSSIITITPVTSTNEGTESTPQSSSSEVSSNGVTTPNESSSSEDSSSSGDSTQPDESDVSSNTSKPGFIPGAY